MPEFDQEINQNDPFKLITRLIVTLLSVFFTQFALLMVPHFFPFSSLFPLLFLSVLALLAVAGLGRFCKRLLGVRASAPAFVFINVLFVWSVYIVMVRKAISPLQNVIFNMELVLLVIGLCRIISSDPGFVTCGSSDPDKFVNSPFSDVEARFEELEPATFFTKQEFPGDESPVSLHRVRYCKYCKAHVKGFDHHCPAFGNCIGEKNHALFIVLLIGFIISEVSYVEHTFQCKLLKNHMRLWRVLNGSYEDPVHHRAKTCHVSWAIELSLYEELVISTMLFSVLQVIWQVVFLIWHIYCICSNIKTDEWINWKRYEEFQLIVQLQPKSGQLLSEIRFTNPYDKGILQNVIEFLKAE